MICPRCNGTGSIFARGDIIPIPCPTCKPNDRSAALLEQVAQDITAKIRSNVVNEIQNAVLAEREACAKIAEEHFRDCHDDYNYEDAGYDISVKIRARKP